MILPIGAQAGAQVAGLEFDNIPGSKCTGNYNFAAYIDQTYCPPLVSQRPSLLIHPALCPGKRKFLALSGVVHTAGSSRSSKGG